MQSRTQQQLEQISRSGAQGYFGREVQIASEAYSKLSGAPLLSQFVSDYYRDAQRASADDAPLNEICDLVVQLILVVYREALKRDATVANALAASLTEDYAGTMDSHLLPQWATLYEASYAFKQTCGLGNPLLAWQAQTRLCQAVHEFAGGLLGFLILGWRAGQGQRVNPNVLTNTLGAKLNEFIQLTGGEDGAFYLFGRLLKPEIRNAIAHGDIWQDEADQVHYVVNREPRQEKQISLLEFAGITAAGSYLGVAYILALSILIVANSGDEKAWHLIPLIPSHLQAVLSQTG